MLEIHDEKYLAYDEDELFMPRDLNFLIVDDENDVSELLATALKEFGFTGNFIFASSTEEAISICNRINKEEKPPFDFILCDWNLTGLSGLDLLMMVRSHTVLYDTPFVMVTANDNVSGMLVATKKGCSDYLVKPFTMEELQLKLAISWEKHRKASSASLKEA